jgi:fucose 4-O-acetylase-like acetyltransferase
LENIIQYGTIRPADMLQIIWFPRAHFWFLYVLFLCSAVALAVNIIAASERRARIMMILLAASWHAIFPWLPSGPIKDIGMNLPYFVLGWLLTSHKSGISSCWRTTLMAWSAFLAAAIPAVIYGLETSVMLRLPLGILGITATCLTAMQISAWKPIIYTGRNSMAIYVIHVLAIYALFMLIKIPSTPGAAGAATLVGVVGPLVFREICKRLHLTRMLGI